MNHYKKGSIIFHEGDTCQLIGQVISGELLIQSYLVNGSEVIYRHLGPGDFFGHNLLFSDDQHYRGDIIALADSEICFLTKKAFIQKIQSDEDFLIRYLHTQANELKELNHHHRLISIPLLKERFFYLLSYKGGELESDSVSSLAKELAVSRESLSRLLNQLQAQGSILIQKAHRYLNIKKKG